MQGWLAALRERVLRAGSRRLLIAGFVLVVVLGLLGTWWLLGRGTRGAEIANVLALPVALACAVLAVLGLLVPSRDSQPSPSPTGKRNGALPGSRPTGLGRQAVLSWVRQRPRAGVVLLLVLCLATTGPFWAMPLAGRTYVLVAGCSHATELRVLTSPEQLEPVRRLAERYQDAARQYGCAAVHLYVYALPTRQARDVLAARWPDAALRDAGPRPDVWLAESARKVTQVRTAMDGMGAKAISTDITVAQSPIVLGVPASAGDVNSVISGPPWSAWFQTILADNWSVVRPDPISSPAGELGTALIYGDEGRADPALARSIEQRVGRSLDRGEYPLGGSLDVLCRYRRLPDPQRTAVVVSEQALARFNNGDPLAGACARREGPRNGDDLLVAYYPSDTRSLDHRFVRFDWSAPAQADAAAAFGDWLVDEDGARVLAEVGLRPPGFSTAGGLLTPRNGVRPDATAARDSMPDDAVDSAMAIHQSAQRRGRVLLALDSSGSMSAPVGAGQDSRFSAASRGVARVLELIGERDEFGLSVFPADPAGTGVRLAVPIGQENGLAGGQERRLATGAALNDIRPAGNTPLYRAIVDGVTALGPSSDTDSNALLVLTDGEDTTSELTDTQVVDAVSGKGVRVFVVAVGEGSCATPVLQDITTNSGGRCLDADLSSIDTKLAELFGTLWSGD